MDLIERQAAIDAMMQLQDEDIEAYGCEIPEGFDGDRAVMALRKLPSAELEPLSDAYMKSVWTWLIDYQIKSAELQGRYTPYEVLSWVANDWRKEHEQ